MENLMKLSSRKQLLSEASQTLQSLREAEEKISQKVENSVKRMREATKKANRSEALFELAKLLAEQKYSKILDHTAEIRKIAGTMPYGIQQYENELMTEMLAKAKQRFNVKEYAAIYSAL